jgi:3-deoxy-manno-octulosonate cytidylyltransferase (CMP-KDO synthetase)
MSQSLRPVSRYRPFPHDESTAMSAARNPIVLIPSRMASTRLPGKPLADICGEPMIVHVWRRAMEADVGPVAVAAAEPEIVAAIERVGGRALLTRPEHPSGSDRIFEALERLDPDGRHDVVVNVQGDLPTIDPAIIRAALPPLEDPAVDIGTLGVVITNEEDRTNPSVPKVVIGLPPGARIGRALYFSRVTVPGGEGPHYYHIGLYAYRRDALARFVRLPPGVLETRERLEQLRALEAGMRIDMALVDTIPSGVDTPADLALARQVIAGRGRG